MIYIILHFRIFPSILYSLLHFLHPLNMGFVSSFATIVVLAVAVPVVTAASPIIQIGIEVNKKLKKRKARQQAKRAEEAKLLADELKEYHDFLRACAAFSVFLKSDVAINYVQWDDEFTGREVIFMRRRDIAPELHFLFNCKDQQEVIEQAVPHWDSMIHFYKKYCVWLMDYDRYELVNPTAD